MVSNVRNQVIEVLDGGQEAAEKRAREIEMASFREVMPVRVFRQGQRTMISGVLPIRVINRVLSHQAATRG